MTFLAQRGHRICRGLRGERVVLSRTEARPELAGRDRAHPSSPEKCVLPRAWSGKLQPFRVAVLESALRFRSAVDIFAYPTSSSEPQCQR